MEWMEAERPLSHLTLLGDVLSGRVMFWRRREREFVWEQRERTSRSSSHTPPHSQLLGRLDFSTYGFKTQAFPFVFTVGLVQTSGEKVVPVAPVTAPQWDPQRTQTEEQFHRQHSVTKQKFKSCNWTTAWRTGSCLVFAFVMSFGTQLCWLGFDYFVLPLPVLHLL